MKYNIIGDVHSRSIWRKLVREDCINVFVGDYFSPYFPYSFDEQAKEFMDIIMYKVKHPETILLIGNHDEDHWHIQEQYSRFNYSHVNDIKQLFEENKDFFQIAYSIDNKILISHAGVTTNWFNNYLKDTVTDVTPDNLADAINNLWLSGKYHAFDFRSNSNYFDCYGDSPQHGPLWVRPQTLSQCNIFNDTQYMQVVGHTQVEYIDINENPYNILLVDTLGFGRQSLIIEANNGIISFGINFINEE